MDGLAGLLKIVQNAIGEVAPNRQLDQSIRSDARQPGGLSHLQRQVLGQVDAKPLSGHGRKGKPEGRCPAIMTSAGCGYGDDRSTAATLRQRGGGNTTSPGNVGRLRTDAPRAGSGADRESIAHDLPLEALGQHAMTTTDGAQWVLGADVCRGSWAGIMWDGITIKGLFASTIAELVDSANAVGVVEVVAIDIPIGLPDADPRPADEQARAFVGPRRSSVFPTPIREALLAPNYQAARTVSLKLTKRSLSAQAYALRAKILEVEAWLATASVRVVETHPEVCFRAMNQDVDRTGDDAGNDHYVQWPKSVWAGQTLRLDLLARQGLNLAAADLTDLHPTTSSTRQPAPGPPGGCCWVSTGGCRKTPPNPHPGQRATSPIDPSRGIGNPAILPAT